MNISNEKQFPQSGPCLQILNNCLFDFMAIPLQVLNSKGETVKKMCSCKIKTVLKKDYNILIMKIHLPQTKNKLAQPI